MPTKPLRNILIIGAGGTNIGHHLAVALSADPLFQLSILTRPNSKSTHPPNATLIPISSNPTHAAYVQAFKDQDAIVSCLGFEGKKSEKAMIDAAVEAGVRRFLPSEYGVDNTNPAARELSPVFEKKGATIEYLQSEEGSGLEWTAVPTGMWLDWYALNPAAPFIGIDIHQHTVEYWSEPPYRFSFTTLPTAAEALRLILHRPDATRNRVVPVQNFLLSQADIVALLEEILGVKYCVSHLGGAEDYIESMKKRWTESGEKDMEARLGLAKAAFLLPGFGSSFEENRRWGLGNALVGFEAGMVRVEDVVREALERYAT